MHEIERTQSLDLGSARVSGAPASDSLAKFATPAAFRTLSVLRHASPQWVAPSTSQPFNASTF
jgi:hypothetical protein